ncbi:MAG: sigma-54-dependent Fis family transcriptional regulator [Rhodobacteraceae bacterium]|jgi:two-component system nitrogen regulation response regulator NtrX|nr:sigma-54-dependent Fis family transcriptional regulator [Paracoccaceae bacterium]NCX83372.1 sigma-54-dependent Fis family transcriptional regulator [Paracoccaceae bacterium]NDI12537.1 sigma-54-dependent Fis family transcriptional regulator [Paracoccaceae bacterium]
MSDILIVDDERDIRELISEILIDEGYTTRLAGTADDAMREVTSQSPGLLILDIWLKDSDMDGIDILKKVKSDYPEVPVVIISGHGNIEIAVAAIKQGAYDFIEKPFNIDQLLVVIRRAMETSRLRRENITLRKKDAPVSDLIGSSAGFRALVSQLDKVAKSNSRIMLRGGSGVGKETAARYIHAQSDRAAGPFVVVGCATIEPDRMEEVLFGRESGDQNWAQGLLEQAHGGVIYFDEVADMPLVTQSKILRVLVDQKFQRVGGNDQIKVDLRVLSSTSCDLEVEIAERRFREELYHRLNVVPVEVPTLEERREDIPELVEHFVEHFNQTQGLNMRKLSDDAATLLQTLPWPGNIRQLKNVIERILILSDGTGPISADEIPTDKQKSAGANDGGGMSANWATLPLREAREAFEREYLITQINRFGGNISKTANFVGMERSALHRKLKSLGVVSGNKSKSAEEA